jgi:hypothetical protein
VELHEVEPLLAQALQRPVDDRPHIGAVDTGEIVPIGHELGVDLERAERFRAPLLQQALTEAADHLLDTGVDVGAVEGCDARLHEGRHIGDGTLLLDRSVPARELPAAAQDARDAIAWSELRGFGGHERVSSTEVRGTAVTSAWRKTRFAIRVMRKRVGQFGSGQATSASVDIQSLACVARCLAGRSGRRAASE